MALTGNGAAAEAIAAPKSSGVDPASLQQALASAEPLRLKALSAALNLTFCLSIVMISANLLSTALGIVLLTLIPAMVIWPLSTALWRSFSLSVMAPLVAERWGQSEFSSGLGAMQWSDLWTDTMMPEQGMRYTRWRSAGAYGGTRYRARETSFHPKHGGWIQHHLIVEIRLEKNTGGKVEVTAKTPRGRFGFGPSASMKRQTTDPAFDAVFDVIASSPAHARDGLTPPMRTALLDIAAQTRRGAFGVRIEHGWLLLHLDLGAPSLRGASLLKPMPELLPEAERVWWELTFPHRLIDTIRGEHDGRLH